MRHSIIALLLIALSLQGCAQHDREIEAILHLADQRASVDHLAPYLQHPAKSVRRQAIIALGQMLDTTAVDLLLPFVQDRSAGLRVETVFALGQLGTRRAQKALVQRWPVETDLEVQQAILEALGKIGDASVLPTLQQGLKSSIPILRGEAALALGRMAYRHLTLPPVASHLQSLLRETLAEVRWRAAYALMRLSEPGSDSLQQALLQDNDPRVRMFAARGLGLLGMQAAVPALVQLAHKDPDWRVRVNATQALGRLAPEDVFQSLPWQDENEHVRLAAFQALGQATRTRRAAFAQNRALIHFLQQGMQPSPGQNPSWRERGAACNVLAAILHEKSIESLEKLMQEKNASLRARLASAFGRTHSPKALTFLQTLYRQGPAVVKVAVLDALSLFDQPIAHEIASEALVEKDPVLTALAANYFAARPKTGRKFRAQILQSFRQLSPPIDTEAASMIFQAFAKLKAREAVPVLQAQLQIPDRAYARAAAKALQALTGQSYTDRLPPATKPHLKFSLQDTKALRGKTAIIQTRYGEMEIELFPQQAPITTLNFVRLAQKGFFDGLTFHRVVPNFVIQGGDPRGDSWGSPGYTIRSEFNRLHYFRGMVGMASAGPDTEGCQFFITHSVQPHLDGRYTIFGRVKRGREVLDKIQAGDPMLKVVIR